MSEGTGKFIVLEGLDGCGKSTQLEHLRKRMSTLCRPAGRRKVFVTREPSDSVPGLICRGISKGTVLARSETEALLFAADRYEHIQSEILPQLQAGNHVLCDRFYLSSFAYQTAGISMDTIFQYNRASLESAVPDVTIFLDVSPEECERRRAERATAEEKYENVNRAKEIRERYMQAIEFLRDYNKEVLILDGTGDPEQVFETLWIRLSRNVLTEKDYQ